MPGRSSLPGIQSPGGTTTATPPPPGPSPILNQGVTSWGARIEREVIESYIPESAGFPIGVYLELEIVAAVEKTITIVELSAEVEGLTLNGIKFANNTPSANVLVSMFFVCPKGKSWKPKVGVGGSWKEIKLFSRYIELP